MVVFFLAATVKLQSDDNACLWVPTFLVPAFLSTIVAVRPQLSGQMLSSAVGFANNMYYVFYSREHVVESSSCHLQLFFHVVGTYLDHPTGEDTCHVMSDVMLSCDDIST